MTLLSTVEQLSQKPLTPVQQAIFAGLEDMSLEKAGTKILSSEAAAKELATFYYKKGWEKSSAEDREKLIAAKTAEIMSQGDITLGKLFQDALKKEGKSTGILELDAQLEKEIYARFITQLVFNLNLAGKTEALDAIYSPRARKAISVEDLKEVAAIFSDSGANLNVAHHAITRPNGELGAVGGLGERMTQPLFEIATKSLAELSSLKRALSKEEQAKKDKLEEVLYKADNVTLSPDGRSWNFIPFANASTKEQAEVRKRTACREVFEETMEPILLDYILRSDAEKIKDVRAFISYLQTSVFKDQSFDQSDIAIFTKIHAELIEAKAIIDGAKAGAGAPNNAYQRFYKDKIETKFPEVLKKSSIGKRFLEQSLRSDIVSVTVTDSTFIDIMNDSFKAAATSDAREAKLVQNTLLTLSPGGAICGTPTAASHGMRRASGEVFNCLIDAAHGSLKQVKGAMATKGLTVEVKDSNNALSSLEILKAMANYQAKVDGKQVLPSFVYPHEALVAYMTTFISEIEKGDKEAAKQSVEFLQSRTRENSPHLFKALDFLAKNKVEVAYKDSQGATHSTKGLKSGDELLSFMEKGFSINLLRESERTAAQAADGDAARADGVFAGKVSGALKAFEKMKGAEEQGSPSTSFASGSAATLQAKPAAEVVKK